MSCVEVIYNPFFWFVWTFYLVNMYVSRLAPVGATLSTAGGGMVWSVPKLREESLAISSKDGVALL